MPSYRYTAHDRQGRERAGELAAVNLEQARSLLEAQGLSIAEIEELASAAGEGRLSAAAAERLTEHLAELSAADVPLGPGLRAAAEESDDTHLAGLLIEMADALDHGRTLEEVLNASADRLPAAMQGLLRTAARTGEVGPALTDLVEHYRSVSALERGIRSGLAYPLLVAAVGTVMFVLATIAIGSGFEPLFHDFGMQLPLVTVFFFWWRRVGMWLLLALVLVVAVIGWIARRRMGQARWHQWLAGAPLVGPLWHWLGLVQWLGLVRVLVRHKVGLLDALRISADGATHGNVRQIALGLADAVARGRSLSQAMTTQRQLPASLIPLVRWGEEGGGLVESLNASRELLAERVRTRSIWLESALPPLLFIAIGCGVVFLLSSLFLATISLIQNLT